MNVLSIHSHAKFLRSLTGFFELQAYPTCWWERPHEICSSTTCTALHYPSHYDLDFAIHLNSWEQFAYVKQLLLGAPAFTDKGRIRQRL